MVRLQAPEFSSNVEDGTHFVTLLRIEERKTITPKSGVNAGKEMEVYPWIFSLDDGTEIEASTSAFMGPKSTIYKWLTALNNGKAPYTLPVPDDFESEPFHGRRALAQIKNTDAGWPRIEQLTAIPLAMQQQAFTTATGLPPTAPVAVAPVAALAAPAALKRPTPVVAEAAATPVEHDDGMPF